MKWTLTKHRLLLGIALFSLPSFLYAMPDTQAISKMLSGFTLDLGLTVSQSTLSVGTESKELGILSGKMKLSPLFNLGSPYRYLNESDFGYNFQYAFSSFSFNTQEVGDDDIDLGTSAKGYFFYAMPVFFYNIGDKKFTEDGKGLSFKMGTGIGPGYLTVDGDVIFTEQFNSRHEFKIEKKYAVTLAIYVLFDLRYNNWVIRAKGGGPSVYFREFQYDLFDFSMDLGYAFRF